MKKLLKILLITKEAGTFPSVENWCAAHGVHLISQSFIRIEPVPNLTIPETNWIFFSSPKGARAYLDLYPIKAEKVGVFGPATGAVLEKQGISIHFTGDAADSPEKISRAFNSTMSSKESVLFPVSQRSQKSISKGLNNKEVIHLVTYQTLENVIPLDATPDYALFTSPSNFEAYKQSNTIHPEMRVIAMGATTEKIIRQHLPEEVVSVLDRPDAESLLKILEKLI